MWRLAQSDPELTLPGELFRRMSPPLDWDRFWPDPTSSALCNEALRNTTPDSPGAGISAHVLMPEASIAASRAVVCLQPVGAGMVLGAGIVLTLEKASSRSDFRSFRMQTRSCAVQLETAFLTAGHVQCVLCHSRLPARLAPPSSSVPGLCLQGQDAQ